MAPRKITKGYHCAYDIHDHFVFVVKYRRALLRAEVEAELVRLSHEIAARYDITLESLGADTNHVHLLCSAHPKTSPGQIARIYKSITAIQLFKTFPALKKELWGGQFWSDGYFVATVGLRGGWSALVRYITNQGQKPEVVNLRFLFPTANPTADPPPDER